MAETARQFLDAASTRSSSLRNSATRRWVLRPHGRRAPPRRSRAVRRVRIACRMRALICHRFEGRATRALVSVSGLRLSVAASRSITPCCTRCSGDRGSAARRTYRVGALCLHLVERPVLLAGSRHPRRAAWARIRRMYDASSYRRELFGRFTACTWTNPFPLPRSLAWLSYVFAVFHRDHRTTGCPRLSATTGVDRTRKRQHRRRNEAVSQFQISSR